jgi:hypothetical protein
MPRYFFHVIDGQKFRDPLELTDDDKAREHARAYARTISRFHRDPSTTVNVTNDGGAEIFRVSLHDAPNRNR